MNKRTIASVVVLSALGAALWVPRAEEVEERPAAVSGPDQAARVEISAVGDIMLDRSVRSHIEEEGSGYPFAKVPGLFSGSDIVVGNLEGGFTDNPSVSVQNHGILHFTFDPSLAAELKRQGFSVLSLANNHAVDFGRSGYASSVRYLTDAGIAPFGSPSNDERLSTVVWAKGKAIAFVGYHQFYSPDASPVVSEIESLRGKADFIVVYPHWGVEYDTGFTADQEARAHAFIDAGADAVIGSHPHVIEPIEVYKGKPIFYSLGNFVFDQDFSKNTERGLEVTLSIGDGSVSYGLKPFEISHSQIKGLSREDSDSILATIASTSPVDDAIRSDIRSGSFTVPR